MGVVDPSTRFFWGWSSRPPNDICLGGRADLGCDRAASKKVAHAQPKSNYYANTNMPQAHQKINATPIAQNKSHRDVIMYGVDIILSCEQCRGWSNTCFWVVKRTIIRVVEADRPKSNFLLPPNLRGRPTTRGLQPPKNL